jgi:cell division protease FtsH
MTEEELLGKIDVLLGGRAAEEIVFGKISTGAANDLTRATDIARRMITDYGMSSRFRNVALTKRHSGMLGEGSEDPWTQREYSEATQQYIDEEIALTINGRYKAVKERLSQDRPLLDQVAQTLLEKESIDEKEFKSLVKEKEAA